MKLVTNNGQIINDVPLNNKRSMRYLKKFWRFPQKENVEKEKEKYYVNDYKRYWQIDIIKQKNFKYDQFSGSIV